MDTSQIGVFCTGLSPFLQLVGSVLHIFKILIPLILIIVCIIDIGKIILSSKNENKGAFKNMVMRIIACVLLFFVPAIFMLIFGFVSGYNKVKEESGIDYSVCYDCLFFPYNDNCEDAVLIASDELGY